MENGILQLTISKPAGHVTGIKCYGIDNLVEVRNKEDNRGYMTLYTLFFLVLVIYLIFLRKKFYLRQTPIWSQSHLKAQ